MFFPSHRQICWRWLCVYGTSSPVRTDCRPYSQSGPKRLEDATLVTMYAAGVRGSDPSGTSVRHIRQAHPPGTSVIRIRHTHPSYTSGRHIPPGTSRQARPSVPVLTHIYNKVPSEKVPSRVRPEPPWNGMKAVKRARISAGNARKRAENVAFRPRKSPRKPHFPQENRFPAAIITKNDKFISLIFR